MRLSLNHIVLSKHTSRYLLTGRLTRHGIEATVMSDRPRFIYHHDGTFLHWVQPPISTECFLNEIVNSVAGRQVDTISCHMYSFGSAVPLYPTSIDAAKAGFPVEAATVNIWKAIKNMQAMESGGVDHWRLAIGRGTLDPRRPGRRSVAVGDDLQSARRERVLGSVTLLLDFLYLTGDDVFEPTINGRQVPFDQGRFRVSDQFDLNYAGISGHVTVELDLPHHDCIRESMNELRLVLKQRPEDISKPVVFYALRLDVKYHLVSLRTAGSVTP